MPGLPEKTKQRRSNLAIIDNNCLFAKARPLFWPQQYQDWQLCYCTIAAWQKRKKDLLFAKTLGLLATFFRVTCLKGVRYLKLDNGHLFEKRMAELLSGLNERWNNRVSHDSIKNSLINIFTQMFKQGVWSVWFVHLIKWWTNSISSPAVVKRKSNWQITHLGFMLSCFSVILNDIIKHVKFINNTNTSFK